jgi:hypothetical protein
MKIYLKLYYQLRDSNITSSRIVDLLRFPNPSTPAHTVEPAVVNGDPQ